MRIALACNMNNNFFAIARYLRDFGIEADLLLCDNEMAHFRPECDTYDLAHRSWTKQLSWGSGERFRRTSASQVRADLNNYDVVVGCGFIPAYCDKAGRKLDVFLPYGSDVEHCTQLFHQFPPYHLRWASAIRAQQRGIRNCYVHHCLDLMDSPIEAALKKYKGGSQRWFEPDPMVYAPCYAAENVETMTSRTHWGHVFADIRSECDIMMMSHSRHVWKQAGSTSNKGTDVMLRGWAIFLAQHPGVRAKLVTLEYGPDVAASKHLISDLGIQDSVVWMPQMYRKDLMVGLILSDVIASSFSWGWVISGTIFESLVSGTPLLTFRDDELYAKTQPELARDLYPVLNARTPDQIAEQLGSVLHRPEQMKQMGIEGRAWYDTYVVHAAMDRYLGYMKAL